MNVFWMNELLFCTSKFSVSYTLCLDVKAQLFIDMIAWHNLFQYSGFAIFDKVVALFKALLKTYTSLERCFIAGDYYHLADGCWNNNVENVHSFFLYPLVPGSRVKIFVNTIHSTRPLIFFTILHIPNISIYWSAENTNRYMTCEKTKYLHCFNMFTSEIFSPT